MAYSSSGWNSVLTCLCSVRASLSLIMLSCRCAECHTSTLRRHSHPCLGWPLSTMPYDPESLFCLPAYLYLRWTELEVYGYAVEEGWRAAVVKQSAWL